MKQKVLFNLQNLTDMLLMKRNEPTKLMGKRNWVENFFTKTEDFLKNWNWDLHQDLSAINVKEEKDAFIIDVAANTKN